MSIANPKKAIAALLPSPIKCGVDGVEVLPLSLGHYAILEKIDSPLLWDNEKLSTRQFSTLDLIPSLFIVTHKVTDVLTDFDNLLDISLSWAEALPPHTAGLIRDAVNQQIKNLLDVMPEPEAKKKAVITAG